MVDVPDGDILLHTGDFLFANQYLSEQFSARKLIEIADWMRSQPHRRKILIAGNHDKIFATLGVERVADIFQGCIYLQDSGVDVPLLPEGRCSR